MNDNILKVAFGGNRMVTSNALWQYDYGQILQIKGINLPEMYEVHFSVSDSGNAYVSIGDENGVDIPDELLETGDSIYAHIYLHTGTDDGETEYRIVIPVHKRAKPTHETPTPVQQSEIERLIALAEEIIEHGSSGTGKDGFSPIVEVTEITGGHQLSIQDKTHTVTFNIMDGLKGDKGDKGDTGEQGIQGIQGERGEKGEHGEQGIQGVAGANGKDGKDGKDGADGQDYVLTAQDKADIAQLVVGLIPEAEGSGF